MTTSFPGALDTFSTKVDGVTDVLAADTNNLQDSVTALQAKVGINGSAVATSLDKRTANLEGRATALEALPSIGYGQTWQAVSRSSGTTYQNTTGRPIMLAVTFRGRNCNVQVGATAGSLIQVTGNVTSLSDDANARAVHSLVIPPGHYYALNGDINNCKELR